MSVRQKMSHRWREVLGVVPPIHQYPGDKRCKGPLTKRLERRRILISLSEQHIFVEVRIGSSDELVCVDYQMRSDEPR